MPSSRPVLRSLIAASLLLLLATGIARAAPAGTVVGLSGQCVVYAAGAPVPLRLGQAVQVTDTVDVPPGGKLKLRMTDGSIVSLAPGTRMQIAAYATDAAGHRQDAQLSLVRGLLRAVVTPTAQPARFEVDTAVGTAAVRSTDWFVEAQAASMQVGVLTGSVVMASRATGRGETIPARWGARLEAGRDPVPPRVWAPAEFAAVIARTNVP